MTGRLTLMMVLVFCTFPGISKAQMYMPVDDIQRGMKGIGRTVFQGTQIDTFGVEVLGVLRNGLGPKKDMILARLSGGPLEQTGVIAGMSGSPVYIEGKLVGAVSYSLGAFAKEPIAGITPIGDMMDVLERTATDTLLGRSFGSIPWRGEIAGVQGDVLKPVAVPVMFSGFAPQVMTEFRDKLIKFGLMPLQGGGGEDPSLVSGDFGPGAALGVQLIRGDLSVTGIGTLTHRVGDRVVGFGHPMLYGGRTAMPMTAAFIHQVISSQLLSSKLGSASKTMGVISQDRLPGIAGVIGADAPMMPLRISVSSQNQRASFDMEVLHHRELGPLLVRMAVATSIISAEKLSGETTVEGRLAVYMPHRKPLIVENKFAGARGLGLAALGLTQPMALIVQNPFVEADIDSAVIQLSIEERTQGARIEGLRLDRSHYDGGDTVTAVITLAPLLGKRQMINVSLPIPAHLPPGRLMLQVMSEGDLQTLDMKRAPGAYQPETLDELIRLIEKPGRNDVLIARFVASQPGVTMGGREVSGLPASMMSALALARGSDVVQKAQQSIYSQKRVATDYVLAGTQTAVLVIGKDSSGPTFSGKGGSGEQKR